MGGAGLQGVDAGGVDAAVAQDIGKAGQVLLHLIEGPGEEVPEVVGKDLPRRHPGLPAETFHLPPEVGPVQWPAVLGDKQGPGTDVDSLGVVQQPPPELPGEVDLPRLALVGDDCLPGPYRLQGEESKLADPDAGGADGLHGQEQPLLLVPPGGGEEPLVLPGGELSGLVPAELSLDREPPEAAVRPAQKGEEAVQGGDGPVGPGGRPGGGQMLPVGGDLRRRQVPFPQPGGEGLRLPAVLGGGGWALSLGRQSGGEGCQLVFLDRHSDPPSV